MFVVWESVRRPGIGASAVYIHNSGRLSGVRTRRRRPVICFARRAGGNSSAANGRNCRHERAHIYNSRMVADSPGVSVNLVAAMAERMKGGLAVFVKTPELSPVKTRLAAEVGETVARAAYDSMLKQASSMMRQVQDTGVAVYWAVGEAEGVSHPRWREFPAVFTGEGGLGDRLHHVYTTIQKKHGRAALSGSDCPALSAETVCAALRGARGSIVVGPTTDGGFYLFAAACRISPKIWRAVRYSRGDTLAQLLRHFPSQQIRQLPVLTDVDDRDSLRAAGMSDTSD